METFVRKLLLAAAVTALLATSASGQDLLDNGTFDTDLAGWTPPPALPPETTVDWNSFGNPGGSLLIRSSQSAPASVAAVSACLTRADLPWVPAGDVFYLRLVGEIYAELAPGDNCRMQIAMYENADCSDSPAMSFVGSTQVGVWEPREDNAAINENTLAFRVRLFLSRQALAEPSSCYFDNLSFTGPPPPPLAIPSLHGVGAAAMVGLLLLSGLLRLRHSREWWR